MKILMSLVFYPRGGSAQVARYLSRALIDLGHDVRLISGTLRDGDEQHDAERFFEGIPLTLVDYTEAWQGFERGENPMSDRWAVPFHPSYEDKPGVPDRVFHSLSDAEYEAQVRCWTGILGEERERFGPDVIHLHHLTHANAAAATIFSSTPKLSHLHGTEIKMLERLNELDREAAVAETGPVGRRMLADAVAFSTHFAAISPDIRERGISRLGIDAARITTIPNGVDTTLFAPLAWTAEDRWRFLQGILVEQPQGWDESGVPGSIRYEPSELQRFRDDAGNLRPLAIFVGRFLDFKRVPLLLRAVARVNEAVGPDDPSFNLLVWGGMPGEWEGDHPHTVARELDLPNVFFCGWLPHDVLSRGLGVADVLVAPSYNEPFGQVYIEAMATGLPVIATRSGGPLAFVVDSGPKANGWLSEVDDPGSLASALHDALFDDGERKRRGRNAMELVQNEYDWKAIAHRYVKTYSRLIR